MPELFFIDEKREVFKYFNFETMKIELKKIYAF